MKPSFLPVVASPTSPARAFQDVERVVDVLGTLAGVDMSLALLKESKVGSTVAKLKKHANERVSNRAKVLVKKWKKVAGIRGAGGSQGGEGGVT